MKTPTKVIIEITADGNRTIVFAGDEKLCERSNVMQSAGRSKSSKKGDFYDDFPDEELEGFSEALDDIASFPVFDLSSALWKLREDQE